MQTEPDDKTAVVHDETVFFKRPSSSQPNNRITVIAGEPHGKVCQFGDSIVIGRGSACGLTIENDRYVSREHARIQRQENKKFRLINLERKNTTLLNGKAIRKPALLKTGDRIKVGDTTLKVDLGGSKAGIDNNRSKSGKIKPVLYGLAVLVLTVISFKIFINDRPSAEIQTYLERGDQFFKQEQYDRAKKQYQHVLEIDSEHQEAKNCFKKIERIKKNKKIQKDLKEGQRCFERQSRL